MTRSRASLLILVAIGATSPAAATRADQARFRQGVDGYKGAHDVEIRGGGTAPEPAKAPKASDPTASVDQNNGGQVSQVLIRFDGIIGDRPGQVPRGSTVASATLSLMGHDAGGGNIHAHCLLGDWDLARLTWESARLGGNDRAGLQADGREMTLPIASFASGRIGRFDLDVTQAARLWVADPSKNFGIALTSDSFNGWDFSTSDAADVGARPVLTIVFDPPARR